VDQPKCLEDFESNLLHFWDFAPFRWYRPIFDYGRLVASSIPLNTTMTYQGLFTHHNGMWFDGVSYLQPNTQRWNVHSFSLDVWFKFYDNVGGALVENVFYKCPDQMVCNNSTLPGQWHLWFYAPNNVTFQLDKNTVNTTFTFNPATDYNKWMIVQASTVKLEKQSRICVKVNDEAITCRIVTGYFDDTAANGTLNNLIIGNGFKGFIRKVKIYDWPKNDESMKLMYRTSPQCYKFHHSQAD
jgi:hypothetical protein